MMNLRSKSFWVVLAVLFVLAAFALALFHFHADGEHQDCVVCRLVQAFGLLLLFTAIALFIPPAKASRFQPVSDLSFQPLFLTSKIQGRAPPFLK